MSKEPQSNIAFLVHNMTFSRYGGLSQLFVIDALSKLADAVSRVDAADLVSRGGFMPVDPNAWIGCAKEWRARLDQHLERSAT